MVQSVDKKIEDEEIFSDVDVGQVLKMLRVQALNKLKELSERAGRRTISELNQIIDSTELNEYLRIVLNSEHPTIDKDRKIRPADYKIEMNSATGEKIIRADDKKGLSFCRTISKFVEVTKFKAGRSKNTLEDIHVYKINEDVELPRGLAFYKDKPGHASLIATEDMSWNEMIRKLSRVSEEMLEYYTTIKVLL